MNNLTIETQNNCYKLTIEDSYLNIDHLINFFDNTKFTEATTYIWHMHSKTFYYRMKDANGDYFIKFHPELKIDLLLGRPVIYDESLPHNTILFKAYK